MKYFKHANLRKTLSIILLIASANVFALRSGVVRDTYTLDVFKTNAITAEEIDRKYNKELRQIADSLLHLKTMPGQKDALAVDVPINAIMDGVQKSGDYAYVGMTPIVYPGGKKIGISIDIVEKANKAGNEGMLDNPTKSFPDPNGLLASWNLYEDYGAKNLFHSDPKVLLKYCPAFHCLFGFNHPAIRKYAALFNTEVPKYKAQLVEILRFDKDEQKRGTAAFLLGHLQNGNELVKILGPSMRDPSAGVRNNVMRVLSFAIPKMNDVEFPVDEAIHALAYPTTPDRNKDLYLLGALAGFPRYKQYIKDHACHAVMEQYRLMQSNLHSGAYSVLKNISGKSYDIDDDASWEAWATKNCPNPDMA